ncbi:metalloprotease TIKI2 isoform X2 [Haplochromis burtoni]|uniref:metalloprotease TIKI2 isoform X2 n=1 Tax=Haplochromis burtoni TaxID=8153 RepID=UPI001C2DD3FB|nr:metalloprotease TIKI2 isoform X2 [Haplochromis burtoni]
MVVLPGISWVFLSALLHAVAPWGADRPGRPRQCDAPKSQSDMNSFLWRVKRAHPHPPSYLFGTIHVPYTRVWDFIPNSSKQAFHDSNNVYFELDLTDPLTISKLTSCQLLPHGENLQTLLPRDLYRRLKRHLDYVKHMMPYWMTADQRGRGLYADYLFNAIAGNWERKRPVWVMLMVNSLTEWDVRSRGTPVLDLFLAQEAERMGKTTGAVEQVEEQCHPLNGLNFSQLPHFINSSLPAHDRMTAQQIDSYFRQELIYKRNERMARRVSALLQRNPNQTYFFAFGAGHFLGNHSVLDILRQEGYEIVHMPSDHQEPATEAAGPDLLAAPEFSKENTDTSTGSPISWPTSPEMELELEDPEPMPGLGGEELPHMLLPDSLSQLEEFGRHKRPRKAHRGHGKPRLFSDLWVRIGDGTTPPPNVRIINGYVTVEPPLTYQKHRRRMEIYEIDRDSSPSSTSPSPSSAQLAHSKVTLSCALAWLLSHILFTS